MSQDLKGKVALVTGAARGLGLLVCRDLAREGMRVAGLDMRGELLESELQSVRFETSADVLPLTGLRSAMPSVSRAAPGASWKNADGKTGRGRSSG